VDEEEEDVGAATIKPVKKAAETSPIKSSQDAYQAANNANGDKTLRNPDVPIDKRPVGILKCL
jgi:hypothetical protein